MFDRKNNEVSTKTVKVAIGISKSTFLRYFFLGLYNNIIPTFYCYYSSGFEFTVQRWRKWRIRNVDDVAGTAFFVYPAEKSILRLRIYKYMTCIKYNIFIFSIALMANKYLHCTKAAGSIVFLIWIIWL